MTEQGTEIKQEEQPEAKKEEETATNKEPEIPVEPKAEIIDAAEDESVDDLDDLELDDSDMDDDGESLIPGKKEFIEEYMNENPKATDEAAILEWQKIKENDLEEQEKDLDEEEEEDEDDDDDEELVIAPELEDMAQAIREISLKLDKNRDMNGALWEEGFQELTRFNLVDGAATAATLIIPIAKLYKVPLKDLKLCLEIIEHTKNIEILEIQRQAMEDKYGDVEEDDQIQAPGPIQGKAKGSEKPEELDFTSTGYEFD